MKNKKYRKSKRYYYFRKQKMLGLALILLGIISAVILQGDITVALLTVPFGIHTVLTKDMILLDDYFFETKAKIFKDDEES